MSMPGIGGGTPLSQQQQDYLATAAMAQANNRLQRALDVPTFMRREYGANASNMMRNLRPAFMTQTANPYKGYDPNQFMSSGEYAAAQEYINSMAPQTGQVAPGVDQYGIFRTYGINNPGAQGQSYTAPQMEALNRAYEAYMARTVLGQAPVQAPKLPAVEQPIREIIPPGSVRTPAPQPAPQGPAGMSMEQYKINADAQRENNPLYVRYREEYLRPFNEGINQASEQAFNTGNMNILYDYLNQPKMSYEQWFGQNVQPTLNKPASRPAPMPAPRPQPVPVKTAPLPVPQMKAPARAPAPQPVNMLMPAQPVRGPAPVPVQAIAGRTPSVQPPLMSRPAPRR